ncbi:type II toxin-antitoxin system HicB family antitoxin [Anoxybacillus geothermalis]|uniref:type II toxin-antitoxin system HicB family antitoxin n=1 Tax=Geobacillus TaxID=129337 RepID=UPI000500A07C|nr:MULTISPECIES: type II toxin-antitoxin system HicB family antitoxin [unclassified Geobacillus]KFL14703.1 pilus assembly protein HicB [Geobacillus stearothermophilus]MED0654741.1 type II toxin-antitoxin system HicB family antitoxin [Anoxybacillus geothermalis]AMQ21668.1 pilus assembly protein HicB [Geobacillus sp. JS12]KFX35576.1 pilus assembly protein HicB [Geobacillus stearothermophilus]KZM58406.1 pilus assembly protein HicB [Geobacillus stearothermophilus]
MHKKDRYIYPAIFDYSSDGISVEFPDLPGCFTCGDTEEDAFKMAKEAMALHLYGLEQENEEIPEPSKVSEIQTENNQVIVFIEVWMPPFRHEMENRAVKKTLTIPKWLDDLAKEHNVNYSQILQEALKKHLGATDR